MQSLETIWEGFMEIDMILGYDRDLLASNGVSSI